MPNADSGPFEADADATPLTKDERDALIPHWITLRSELNAAELANILKARAAVLGRRGTPGPMQLLNEDYITRLHKRMFGDVWRWAGRYRRSERNIGVPWTQIPMDMRALVDDAKAWITCGAYPPDELAVRFHHRLVAIHPFPNGNGRISRFLADLLVVSLGGERFSWGAADLVDPGATRARYIAALRQADRNDVGPLLVFARS